MLQSRIKKSLFAVTLSVAGLGVAGTAHAAIYTGHWDPAYGNIFPDLGWEASATFDVPAACLGQADGSYAISGNCSGFKVLTAEVDFYNSTFDSNPLTSPVLESFTLNPGVNVTGIDISGGMLSGVDTDFFNYFVPSGGSSSIAGGGNYSFSLLLFGGNRAQLVAVANPLTASPGCIRFPIPGVDCQASDVDAIGVFAPVPEPETYALMLAGLAAVGFMTRRRRA